MIPRPGVTIATRILAFSYKPEIDEPTKQALRESILNLQTKCRRDGHPYIRDISAGSQKSSEPFSKGLEYMFIITFNSFEERSYFIREDPEHQAFQLQLNEVVSNVWIGDFQDSVWA
ncbi:hypothetical protein HWV62_14540 [Athelia sp. TMB]|nr:hypothetical protein HWV62_14540 [Athelia sp. TMB]